jgi:hypothetical protein
VKDGALRCRHADGDSIPLATDGCAARLGTKG